MRTLTTLSLLLLLLPFWSQAQEINSTFDKLSEKLQTVEAEKDSYEQSIEQSADNPCKLTITIEATDHKGRVETERFEFYWSDLEENAVRYEVKRDLIYVEFSSNNRQSLIKYFEDGEFDGYQRDGYILAADSKNAKELVEHIKKGIEVCEEMPNQDAPPESYNELIPWLNERIAEIEIGEEAYIQQFSIEEEDPNRLIFSRSLIDDKGRSTNNRYHFNPADFNHRQVEFDISRDEVEIKLNTIDNMKMAKSFEDEEFDGYENDFSLYLNDVELARNVVTALQRLIEMGEKRLENALPEVNTLSQVGEVISKNVIDVNIEDETIKQNFMLDKDCWVNYGKDIIEGETENNQYYFNLSHIITAKLEFDISGRNEILVPLEMEKDLIRHIQNDELQNYDQEIELVFDNIESARNTIHALKAGIPMCKEVEMPIHDLSWLIENTGEITVDDETFSQNLKMDEEKPCNLELSVKGPDDEYIYEFLIEDLNPKDVDLDVSRSELFIVLSTNRNEKLIKTFENGEPGDYENEVRIRMKGPKSAMVAKNTWEKVIENCQ